MYFVKKFLKNGKIFGVWSKNGEKTPIFQHKNKKCPMKIELDIDITGMSKQVLNY